MEIFVNILRGLAIGIANIIPGVSGGTMALLLGIYDRLLTAISQIGPDLVFVFKTGLNGLKESWKKIDGTFLASLGIGAGIAIVAMAKIMAMLLEKHHDPTYGFFFGLVLASAVVPWQLIKKVRPGVVISMLTAALMVIILTSAMSGEERLANAQKKAALKQQTAIASQSSKTVSEDPANLAFFCVAGVIAISAMILPGISGSFMMLLLGIYFDILICINERQLIPLVFFAIGCVAGLLLFTRFLKFLLSRYHDMTMAFLSGLVIGSLFGIWPFKSFGFAGGRRVDIANIMPVEFGSNEVITLAAVLAGVIVVALFMVIESRQNLAAKKNNC